MPQKKKENMIFLVPINQSLKHLFQSKKYRFPTKMSIEKQTKSLKLNNIWMEKARQSKPVALNSHFFFNVYINWFNCPNLRVEKMMFFFLLHLILFAIIKILNRQSVFVMCISIAYLIHSLPSTWEYKWKPDFLFTEYTTQF